MAPGFDPRSLLIALRDGMPPDPAQLRAFVAGMTSGAISDAQVGAFAMAVCQRGLGEAGRTVLTEAMRDSGDVLAWDLPGPVVDKHSTGGIGDSISLLLAPALAASGVYVPMISGRGLGHSGGTLDKLAAIPGYQTTVDEARFRQVTRQVGCAIVGATGQIAPADKRLYAVRDVTGTVESIDLITASILSKKLAAGLSALVLDVKVGSGAFMRDRAAAQALAEALVATANRAGCRTKALITDMDQPLAMTAGNGVEVAEVMGCLTGQRITQTLWDLTKALGGTLLAMAGQALDAKTGEAMIEAALQDGRAAENFGAMVAALGGPRDFLENWQQYLPSAPVQRDVFAGPSSGPQITAVDTRAVGMAVVALGGGRLRETDEIDPSVGFTHLAHLGESLADGRPLARVHARSEAEADRAEAALRAAYSFGSGAVVPPLIHEIVG